MVADERGGGGGGWRRRLHDALGLRGTASSSFGPGSVGAGQIRAPTGSARLGGCGGGDVAGSHWPGALAVAEEASGGAPLGGGEVAGAGFRGGRRLEARKTRGRLVEAKNVMWGCIYRERGLGLGLGGVSELSDRNRTVPDAMRGRLGLGAGLGLWERRGRETRRRLRRPKRPTKVPATVPL